MADLIVAARVPGPSGPPDLRAEPWFRIDPLLDPDGALRGQRLAVGIGGGRVPPDAELPPESFAAGPFGRIVLVGSDDGTTSQLRGLDVATGCAWVIATEHDVIRRATIDPAGAGIYETRVARATRGDLGVWLRPMDGRDPARRVLAPLPADERFGRTFSTEFTWDVAGTRLAIQSCGEVACRTRVLAPAGGPIVTLDDPDLGVLIGFGGDRLVSYGACRGLPCPIESTDLATGERFLVEPLGGPALVLDTADGARIVHETWIGNGHGLRSVALEGASAIDLGALPGGLGLHRSALDAGVGTRLPPGWILLAPDGRLPADNATDRSELRHVPDGATVPFDEATR